MVGICQSIVQNSRFVTVLHQRIKSTSTIWYNSSCWEFVIDSAGHRMARDKVSRLREFIIRRPEQSGRILRLMTVWVSFWDVKDSSRPTGRTESILNSRATQVATGFLGWLNRGLHDLAYQRSVFHQISRDSILLSSPTSLFRFDSTLTISPASLLHQDEMLFKLDFGNMFEKKRKVKLGCGFILTYLPKVTDLLTHPLDNSRYQSLSWPLILLGLSRYCCDISGNLSKLAHHVSTPLRVLHTRYADSIPKGLLSLPDLSCSASCTYVVACSLGATSCFYSQVL